jgi:type I restriction enzyme S subunit
MTLLKDIVQIEKGRKYSLLEENQHGAIRVFQANDFRNENKPLYTFEKDGILAEENDIMLVWDGSVGQMGYGRRGYVGSTMVKLTVKNKKQFSPFFIYRFLQTKSEYLKRKATGATIMHINRKSLEQLEIPALNLPDQLHIANLLNKAENLKSQRKESIRLLDEFLKNTFLEMFGDPVRNENAWEKDKVISYTDCIVPGRDKPKSFTGNIPWFTTEDLIHKGFVTKSKKGLGLSNEEIKEVRARVIPAGSVLITCVGDLGVITVCKENCVVNQQLHAFICKEKINNLFLMYALSFQTNFMYKKATSTTVPYMNKTTCNSIPVIKPPLSLQTQFAKIVEKTEALKTQYQKSLQELENIYSSLSQRAFKVEL